MTEPYTRGIISEDKEKEAFTTGVLIASVGHHYQKAKFENKTREWRETYVKEHFKKYGRNLRSEELSLLMGSLHSLFGPCVPADGCSGVSDRAQKND